MTDLAPNETVEDLDASPVVLAAPIVEDYQLLPDGRILLAFEGNRWTLRRPLFGEFKVFRAQYLDLARAVGDDQIDLAVKFVAAVFAGLADRPLDVPEDRWPTWLVMGMGYGEWVTHWRDVPLGPGGSPTAGPPT